MKKCPCPWLALPWVVLACLAAGLRAEPAHKAGNPPPNVVFLLTDDMGYGDVGCYGGQFAPTPNIDRLAREGTRFTQYYVASPVCSPSRAALITGMNPGRWNVTTFLDTRAANRSREQVDFLDPQAPSVARAFQAAGYKTGHFGKWHLGGGRDVKNAPPFSAYGFDEHVGTYESPDPDPNITSGNWIWSPEDKVKRWDRTRYFVDHALDFLERHKDQPTFVEIWPDDTHTPWTPSSERLSEYPNGPEQRRNFKAVLDEYDRQVGRLLEGLKKLGLEQNTIFVFSSDNGPMPTFEQRRAAGLRGSKLSLYEGGIREPFIVRWPGHVAAGRVDEQTILQGTDLFPTFCALCGVPTPKGLAGDGENMSRALLEGPQARTKPLFWEYGRNAAFGYPEGRNRSPNVAMRNGKWKLLVNADGTGTQLYDIEADPQEKADVAAQQPDVANDLQARALAWRRTLPKPPEALPPAASPVAPAQD